MRTQLERERKFLVTNDDWKRDVQHSVKISQIYLPDTDGQEHRIRMEHVKGEVPQAFRVTKIYQSDDASITQLDPMLIEEARAFFSAYGQQGTDMALIEKTRYFLGEAWKDGWCVDVFHGAHDGLVLAEYEVKNAEAPTRLHKPAWVGKEVTELKTYRNVALARNGLPVAKRER